VTANPFALISITCLTARSDGFDLSMGNKNLIIPFAPFSRSALTVSCPALLVRTEFNRTGPAEEIHRIAYNEDEFLGMFVRRLIGLRKDACCDDRRKFH